MYRSKVSVQEFLYSVSGLDIHHKQSENNSPVSKNKSVAGGEMQ